MRKRGLVLLLMIAGGGAAGCDVDVRDSDGESPPAAPPAASPEETGGPPGGDYPGPCPVGTWQLSEISPAVGVGVGPGELSFTGGGSMILTLAEGGTWTVTDDGSDPLDATVEAGGATVSGVAAIEGAADGSYAGQGDTYAFETESATGTVELSAPGYRETLPMEDVLAAIVPTGQATLTCGADTLTIDGEHAVWEFTYVGGDSSPEGIAGPGEESTEVREITQAGSHDCAGGSVRITGAAGLRVELTGDCADVHIDSSGNDVEIGSAETLFVNGAGNTVDVSQVGEIRVTGALSDVTWHGDEPRISNEAAGATVQEG